jgi:hypothetical protein
LREELTSEEPLVEQDEQVPQRALLQPSLLVRYVPHQEPAIR